MGGYSQGTAQDLLSSSVTLTAGGSEILIKDDIDLTGDEYAWLFIYVSLNASSTDVVEFRLYKKTGIGGDRASNYCRVKSVDYNEVANGNPPEIGTIQPGIYALYGINYDGTYDANVSQVKINKFSYSTT